MAALVDDDHAIGVAIERDADVSAHLTHLAAECLRRGRAAFLVDVEAVRLDADGDHVGAQFPQRLRHHLVGRAMCAIDDDAQAFEAERARQRPLGEFDVAVIRTVDAAGAADAGAVGELARKVLIEQLLDPHLDVVRELVAVGSEQLDAVVVERIVRGRDHHAEIGAHRARQHRNGRRRHRTEQQHVHADRGEARLQRRLDHVAGQPRILADHDAMPMIAALEHEARRLAHAQRQLRRDHAVGATADSVRPKIFASHRIPHLAADNRGEHPLQGGAYKGFAAD